MNPFAKYPEPPYDAVMPLNWQIGFTIFCAISAATMWAIAVRIYRQEGDYVPLLTMVGGTLCVFAEPIVDVLGMVWFPVHGQWTEIETLRAIPFHSGLAYMAFYGGLCFMTIRKFEKGMTLNQVWLWFAVICLIEFCLEPLPIIYGKQWMYYGNQPFRVLEFPLWWPIVNTVGMFVAAVMIFKLKPHLKGFRSVLIIFLVPSGDLVGNSFTAWPIWNALHTTQGYFVTYAAAILTLGLSAVAVQIMARMVEQPHAPADAHQMREMN